MGGQQVSGVMHIHVNSQVFLEDSKSIYTPTQKGPKSNKILKKITKVCVRDHS